MVGEENFHSNDAIITIYRHVPDYVVGMLASRHYKKKKSTLGVTF